jgi:hypothetical protein
MSFVKPIRVEGLREFSRALKRVDNEAPKGLRLAGNRAAQIVVNEAKPRVPIGPGIRGHAVTSIKAASTRTAARVSEGGKRFPYMPWLDFGGRVGPRKSVRRPFIKQGRYIWSAFADKRDEIEDVLEDAIVQVARDAGLEVT